MNNSQVAHIWAQGNGATANGSNFRCVDNKLYSYATLIGFIERDTAFLSSDSFSNSTGKQLNYARSAVLHRDIVSCNVFARGYTEKPTISDCFIAAASELKEDFNSIARARNREWKIERYNESREELARIAKKLRVKIPALPKVSKKALEEARQAALKEQEKKRKATLKAQAEVKSLFDAWLATGQGQCPPAFSRRTSSGTDYLTVQGENVVTSQRAEAPLSHVKKALAFYFGRKHEDGTFEPYQTNGHSIPLGYFKLDSIDKFGNVKAGCHLFTVAEIARFADHWKLK